MFRFTSPLTVIAVYFLFMSVSFAANLTVELDPPLDAVSFFGAARRWDSDGNPLVEIDTKAKITEPQVDKVAEKIANNRYVFKDLTPGVYDLVIIQANKKIRREGWRYAPVLDFDPILPPNSKVEKYDEDSGKLVEDAETIEAITKEIKGSRHYENRVEIIAMGGIPPKKGDRTTKTVRVLMRLIRDQETSLDMDSATYRIEIWQFDNKNGSFVKNKKTQVMHRILMPRDELNAWKWDWYPSLGNIDVTKNKTIRITIRETDN